MRRRIVDALILFLFTPLVLRPAQSVSFYVLFHINDQCVYIVIYRRIPCLF